MCRLNLGQHTLPEHHASSSRLMSNVAAWRIWVRSPLLNSFPHLQSGDKLLQAACKFALKIGLEWVRNCHWQLDQKYLLTPCM